MHHQSQGIQLLEVTKHVHRPVVRPSKRILKPIRRIIKLLPFVAATVAVQPAVRADAMRVCKHRARECALVNQWYARGTAAGNAGDYYDNRDGGHSTVNVSSFLQLKSVRYTADEKEKRIHWGAQRRLNSFVTIGNSSTAGPIDRYGSNARSAYYTTDAGMRFLYSQYRSNDLYVYPEHQDHDPGHNGPKGYGDLLATNSPYVVVPQGSSGSDRVFVRAFVHTLAAFRPKVKEKLKKTGLLMPTLQMIFRSSNKHISGPKQYLTGKAHPTVFRGTDVDPVKMVGMAQGIQLATMPPLLHLEVIGEDTPAAYPGFGANRSEELCNTSAVIARIVRHGDYQRRIVVSAKRSIDPNRRNLTWHWILLRGDPKRVRIVPRENSAEAEIFVDYPARRPIAPDSPMQSNRVDIGVFAHNGHYYSAPGFITFYSLDNELRTYSRDGRLLEIYYAAGNLQRRIAGWSALFRLFNVDKSDPPAVLLKRGFNAEQRTAITAAGKAYRIALPRLTAAEAESKRADDKFAKARGTTRQAKSRLNAAEARHKSQPTAQTSNAVAQAGSQHVEAVRAERAARREAADARKALNVTRHGIDELFNEPRPVFANRSLRRRLKAWIDSMADDPRFFIDHAQQLKAWARASADQAGKAAFNKAISQIKKLGILKRTGPNQYVLVTVMAGEGPVEHRLSKYERYQIRRFHHVILTEMLYPKILKGHETKNFVDNRLAIPRERRNVYRYNNEGKLTGWTRYAKGHVKHHRVASPSSR